MLEDLELFVKVGIQWIMFGLPRFLQSENNIVGMLKDIIMKMCWNFAEYIIMVRMIDESKKNLI